MMMMKMKRKKMLKRKNSRSNLLPLALILVGISCLGFISCTSDEHIKVKLNIPDRLPFDLEAYEEFVMTDFLIKENIKDFDLNRELQEYFSFELNTLFAMDVELKKDFTPTEDDLKSEDSWAGLSKTGSKRIVFTGAIDYSQEVRKALLSQDKRRFEDPFPNETKLAQRKFYALTMELYLIDAETGKTLYKRTFKETKADKNPNQTAPFAFFQLIQRVKEKLFNSILGKTRLQDRYLIQK
jgi:hypothetical protein